MGFNYDDDKIDSLLTAIYTGLISAYHLPRNLYVETADYLKKALYKGYGGTLIDFEMGTADYQLLNELRNNIYMFSGAKTFTQVLDIKSLMYEGNKTIEFKDFKVKALSRYKDYNVNYLESEYVTAQTSATSAQNWKQAKSSKKFAQLRSVAIIDGNTSPICEKVNGTTLPIDHPFWDHHKSPRHWKCRCHEEIIDVYDEEPNTSSGEVKKIEAFTDDKMQDVFKMNPGKDKVIFKTKGKGKHPYFSVAPQYKIIAKHNFNLPIPPND
jgi:SPP1 gp7 family putative phage head morphogenesis protein